MPASSAALLTRRRALKISRSAATPTPAARRWSASSTGKPPGTAAASTPSSRHARTATRSTASKRVAPDGDDLVEPELLVGMHDERRVDLREPRVLQRADDDVAPAGDLGVEEGVGHHQRHLVAHLGRTQRVAENQYVRHRAQSCHSAATGSGGRPMIMSAAFSATTRMGRQVRADRQLHRWAIARCFRGSARRPRAVLAGLSVLVALALLATAALGARTVTRKQALAVGQCDQPATQRRPDPRAESQPGHLAAAPDPEHGDRMCGRRPSEQGVREHAVADLRGERHRGPGNQLGHRDPPLDGARRAGLRCDASARARCRCVLAEVETGLRASLPAAAKLANASAVRLPAVVTGMADSLAIRCSIRVRVKQGGTTATVSVYADDIGVRRRPGRGQPRGRHHGQRALGVARAAPRRGARGSRARHARLSAASRSGRGGA